MKWDDIGYELDLIHIYPSDGKISVSLIVTDIPEYEFVLFVIDGNTYMVSLYRDKPLEDEQYYPKHIKDTINKFIKTNVSIDTMLDILQDHYNKCISGEIDYDGDYTDHIDWIGIGKNNIKKPH